MNEIIDLVIKSAYFILPPAAANIAPVLANKIFKEKPRPVDQGIKFMGMPLFGSHKTYRGFIAGIILAIIAVMIQKVLYSFETIKNISLIDYSLVNFIVLGFLFGFGALFGDLIESFVKRRFKIKSGKPFIPWDQLDFIIGALLFVSIIYIPSWQIIITTLIITIIFHILFSLAGYTLRFKKDPL